jgi:hypothetical protein
LIAGKGHKSAKSINFKTYDMNISLDDRHPWWPLIRAGKIISQNIEISKKELIKPDREKDIKKRAFRENTTVEIP